MKKPETVVNQGIVRCAQCEKCECVEVTHGEKRIRIGRIVLDDSLPEYFTTEQLVKDCETEDGQLKPDTLTLKIDNSPGTTDLYFATLGMLFGNESKTSDTATEVGKLSEEYIFDILSDPELCPWAADAVVSMPNSEADKNGIDITVTLTTELAELLAQDTLHIQVKTSPPSAEEFYGLAKTLTQSMDGIRENGRPDLHAAAKKWAELRLLFLVAGAGERHPSQVTYEMAEQLKQLIAIHNPAMTDLEIAFRCNVIAPQLEKHAISTRFGNSANVLRNTYEDQYQPIILFLRAMRQDIRNESGQAWTDLIAYLQSNSHAKADQKHKKLKRQKSITTRQQLSNPDQSRKGDSRNGKPHYNGFHASTGR